MSEIRVTSVVGENGGDRVGLTTGLTVGPLTGTTGIGATITHHGHAQFAGVCTATSFVGSGANLTNLSVSSNYKITTGSVINTGNSTSETITGIPSDAVKVELLYYNLKTTDTGIMAMRAGNASNIDSQNWFSAHSYVVGTTNSNTTWKTSSWSSRFQMPHEDFSSANNRRTGIFTFNKHIDNIWFCVNDMVYSENGTSSIARNFVNKGYMDMGASGFDRIKIFTYSNEVNIDYNGKMQLKYYQVV
tara:strand:+ start:930 stop:1667 length:738 start_codon:yes stop_codon:yes gene_type:complete